MADPFVCSPRVVLSNVEAFEVHHWPIGLYNGEPRWRAATDLSELLEPMPTGLPRYQLQQQYLLLDEGAYSDAELAPLPNLVSALFRLENSRTPRDILTLFEVLVA